MVRPLIARERGKREFLSRFSVIQDVVLMAGEIYDFASHYKETASSTKRMVEDISRSKRARISSWNIDCSARNVGFVSSV
jgi:hypothetical protein